uniref:Uncharacterized protein n=1 Tax=Heterorhabditis bacteriophora TaxID=37862 RepID=A0A1I7W9W5_HETBA
MINFIFSVLWFLEITNLLQSTNTL